MEHAVSHIAYQGRRTVRAGSEKRRQNILEAALRIVQKEGVRGIRHRAVAKEANVPLSATTYYFKDIQDLISDTFVYFVEKTITEFVAPLLVDIKSYLQGFEPQALKSLQTKAQIATNLANIVTEYIQKEVCEKWEKLIIEHTFLIEALRQTHLKDLAKNYLEAAVDDFSQLCHLLNSPDPMIDASLLINVIMQMEYEALIEPPGQFDSDLVRKKLHRFFSALIMTPEIKQDMTWTQQIH